MANRHAVQQRKSGGRTRPPLSSGNKDVANEAFAKKKGGAVAARQEGGKVAGRAAGGRLDKRARGGALKRSTGGGADKNPYSSAKI